MILLDVALVLVALGVLAALYRGARGPSGADRVVAAELGFIAAVCALLLLGMRLDLPAIFDFALVVVLIGFLGTLGLVRLVTPTSDRASEPDTPHDDDHTPGGRHERD